MNAKPDHPDQNPANPARRKALPVFIVAAVVIGWFAVAEMATTWWYNMNEAKLPRNQLPAEGGDVVSRLKQFADQQGATAKVEEVAQVAKEMLKCSFGETVSWSNGYSFAAASVLASQSGLPTSRASAMAISSFFERTIS